MKVLIYLWVALGSALGGAARYWCYGLFVPAMGSTFPWGTLLVNVVGSSFIGFFATLTGPDGRLMVGAPLRQFIMAGICGGFTTFSTFSLETLNLARDGEFLKAAGNILLSLGLCLAGAWLGHAFAMSLNRLKAF